MKRRGSSGRLTRFGRFLWLVLPVLLAGCATGTPSVTTSEISPTPADVVIAIGTPRVHHHGAAEPTNLGDGTEILVVTSIPATPTPTSTSALTLEVQPTATSRLEPPPPLESGLSYIIDRGSSGRPEVALTFDAGADRGFGGEILDTLAKYGEVASFGITGEWAEANPDLVNRMVDEGHMVFNHTWSHRSMTGASTQGWDEGVLTQAERIEELRSTEAVIRAVTGYDVSPYFRPPYGDLDQSVLADVFQAGYWVTVMWSCDSLGWNGLTAEEIIERCGSSAQAGDIILLHVGAESQDAAALPGLIESARSIGLELVTVEALLQE
jgi:peptidoglycan-N-acetylglucosamine deacetylase